MFFILLILWIIITLYILYKKKYGYWEKQNVPHLKPVPFLGNYGEYILLRTTIGNVLNKICEKFPNEAYIGAYYGTEPVLIVKDPELIKLILTKNFYYFNGREISDHVEKEPITRGIFFAHGDYWRVLRQNLTPLYTTAKMKNMFPLIEKCSRTFEQLLEDKIKICNIVDINVLTSRYSLDGVGLAAFGIETGVMSNNYENNRFKNMSDRIFGKSTSRGLKNVFRAMWPTIFYALGFSAYPQDINTFFGELLIEVFRLRDYKSSNRNDFVDLILEFNKNEYLTGDSIQSLKTGELKKVSVKVDDELLGSQCASFLGAGYETSGTTLAVTLFEMAKNKHTQVKAFAEIDKYLDEHDNILHYDCISKLPYLDACIDEALRFYPSLSSLTREVMEDYTFPSGLRVKKGLRIHLPVSYIHKNAAYYPEPEQFRPERFLPGEKENIDPYTYLPFGEGFRICLGQRFAKMLIIAGLVTILKNYELDIADGQSSVVEFDPRTVINRPKYQVRLKITPREIKRNYAESEFSSRLT